jgi:hypothetical protein
MSKNVDVEYQKSYQKAYDFLSVSCDAATTAEKEFRNLFGKISQRSIDEKYLDGRNDSSVDLNSVSFIATDVERKLLREFYLEWQAYKVIWQEREDELTYLKNSGKVKTRIDIHAGKIENVRSLSFLKYFFNFIVLVASITVIIKFAF